MIAASQKRLALSAVIPDIDKYRVRNKFALACPMSCCNK